MQETYRSVTYVSILAVLMFACVMLTPLSTYAHGDPLEDTIHQALLADPETANMSEAEIDAMVTVLAAEARGQGVAAEDITWRPREPMMYGSVSEEAVCTGLPSFLCILNDGLGFTGANSYIPLWLFISSTALLFTLWAMIHLYRRHFLKMGVAPPTPSGL